VLQWVPIIASQTSIEVEALNEYLRRFSESDNTIIRINLALWTISVQGARWTSILNCELSWGCETVRILLAFLTGALFLELLVIFTF